MESKAILDRESSSFRITALSYGMPHAIGNENWGLVYFAPLLLVMTSRALS